MTGEQFTIRFNQEPSYNRADFVLGACNALAADWVDRWPDWPGRISGLVVIGPADCGKSHLGAIWQEMSGASRIDRIEDATLDALEDNPHLLIDHPEKNASWPEDLFFHLLNRCAELNGSVMMLTRHPVAQAGWTLPDLSSRLAGMVAAEITPPDDAVLLAVMHKIADDIGLALDPDVSRYIVSRIERSFASARQMIEMIDGIALARKKKATVAVAREILDGLEPRLI